MKSIAEMKDQEQTDCPLLLFECELSSGQVEYWCTHSVVVNGQRYEARILKHSDFELRAGAADGIDGTGRVTVVLANADARFSELEAGIGWKGARLTVRFVFLDLAVGTATTDATTVFLGIANPPEEITESTFRLTFANRMSLQRLQLPDVRIQRRCPWIFPVTQDQRTEAVEGGARGQYSPFYRCGYSADIPGGVGQLRDGQPFLTCNYTRPDCQARGMFGDPARRFGGIEYLPSTVEVRSYGAKESHTSAAVENVARYEDVVPLVYGTAWYSPVIIFARNDGNLTRMEVLLGVGKMQGVLKVLVNGVEVPAGVPGQDMTSTGWFEISASGDRSGSFDATFPDGDPYGSMCVLVVAVPNRIADGISLPKVRVLAQGKVLERFDSSGGSLGEAFTNNPAWVVLDVIRRAGWTLDEVDIASFVHTAEYCDERLSTIDGLGNETTTPRYQCNFALTRRRSAGDIVRGVRAGSGLYLCFGPTGKLSLRAESGLADQQPSKSDMSNSAEALANGWPAYEFGDGTYGYGGILCSEAGAPSIRFWSRSSAETVNRLSVEFQDEQNEYQQDSLSLLDADDFLTTGQEITGGLAALGIPNFSQALRVLRRQLNRSVRGNRYVEFETSVKGIGLVPGDLISLTYLREALDRQLFRIVSISPAANYRTMKITAQIHNDEWYESDMEASSAGGRQLSSVGGIPRPLSGTVQFHEAGSVAADGTVRLGLTTEFERPSATSTAIAGVPLIALSPTVDSAAGSLPGGRVLYYAVTGVDEGGAESGLSFTVAVRTPATSSQNRVILTGLSFPRKANAFHVYRGENPWALSRIAEAVPIAEAFQDDGLPEGAVSPPDDCYEHANVYWRIQTQPETTVSSATASSVSSSLLSSNENSYRGMIVRVSSGPGMGQERAIMASSDQTLLVNPPWTTTPTAESHLTISEASWRFGASTQGNSAEFDIPNERGAKLEVSLRAASAADREAAYELSPIHVWTVGGAVGGDADVAEMPRFELRSVGRGQVELSAIDFESQENTESIQAGTLGLHYRDELDATPQAQLAVELTANGEDIAIASPRTATVNDLLQVGAEVMRLEEVDTTGAAGRVTRGMYGTAKEAHSVGATVIYLKRKVATMGFPRGFFGSLAARDYRNTIALPSAAIAVATLYVTNDQGNSPSGCQAFTTERGGGLRTYGGGQLNMQVTGALSIEDSATPPLVIHEATSVRDVFASVGHPSNGSEIEVEVTLDGVAYCTVTIPGGASVSDSVGGETLPALPTKGVLGLNITKVVQSTGVNPGRDLTVTIRV